MSSITSVSRGFVVSLITFLVLGGLLLAGPHLIAVSQDGHANSVSPVLRQADDLTDGRLADSAEEAEGDDATATVADLVLGLQTEGLAETIDVYLSRDPFQPVVVQTTTGDDGGTVDGGGSTDGSTSGSTDGSTSGSTDGSTSGSAGGSPSGSDDGTACSAGGNEAVCEGTVVSMDGLTSDGKAIIQVDGTRYEVVAGEVFATSFRVERIDAGAGCAFLRYGDEAFTICIGATVLK